MHSNVINGNAVGFCFFSFCAYLLYILYLQLTQKLITAMLQFIHIE